MNNYQNCLSVSTLNTVVRNTLEEKLSDIWVMGEISNFHHHPSSGHMYFTLKDSESEIRCTMFRINNLYLQYDPTNGLEVRIFGSVSYYEKRGQIQIKVSKMEPLGTGNLYEKYELLKKTLFEEGLFDSQKKQKIPPYPRMVGVITSGSSAAYQDIINVLNRRFPNIDILLYSAKVQGSEASQDIVEGIKLLNENSNVDIIIVGRGGGSIEDLWPFNEEVVARAIYASKIPIISAVGHETDYTIADFVSDLRAPTPSAAAELAVPILNDLVLNLSNTRKRLLLSIENKIQQGWICIDQLDKRISTNHPSVKIKNNIQILEKMCNRYINSIGIKYNDWIKNVNYLNRQLCSLGPNQVLERGYSISSTIKGEIIRSANQINVGDYFNVKTSKGVFYGRKASNIKNND